MPNNPNVMANLKPWKKGEGGRPKGVKNKNTLAWEALKDDIINLHTERFNTILTQLPPDKFVNTYLQVLEYFKPKLARNENVNENYNQQLVTISIPSTATAPAFPGNVVEEAEVISETDRVGEGFPNAGLTGTFKPETAKVQRDGSI